MATEDINFRFIVTGNAVPQFKAVQKQVGAVDRQIKRATNSLKAHSSQYNSAAVATNKFAKGALQQAGYQIGDFAVQVANGTSKMQAFGQQGSQFFGIFGPFGAVLGAGIAIVSAIAVAFEKAGKAAEGAAGEIMSLKDAQDALNQSTASYQSQIDQLRFGVDSQAEARVLREILDLQTEYNSLADQYRQTDSLGRRQRIAERIKELKVSLNGLQKEAEANAEKRKAYEKLRNTIERGEKDREAALARMKKLEEERRRVVESIRGAITKETATLQSKIELARTELNFGKDSAQFARLKADQDRAAFEIALKKQGILGNNLKKIMQQYDEYVEVTKELEKSKNMAEFLASKVAMVGRKLSFASAEAAKLSKNLAAAPSGVQAMKDQTAVIQAEIDAIKAGYSEAAASSAAFRKQREQELGLADAANDAERSYISALINSDVKAFEARQRANAELSKVKEVFSEVGDAGAAAMDKIKNKTEQALTPLQEKMKEVSKTIESSMEGAFMSVVEGTNSAKDAFRNMASAIIKELYRVFVVKQITGFITSAIGGFFNLNQVSGPSMPLGTGNIRPPTRPASFAGGGYTGAGARVGGLDGKGGFMAMLHPRETVVDHTKGQGGGVVVNQTINVSTGVQQTVRTEIKSLMPQIAESAKAAVVDAKRRGGSYGRAFA